MTALAAVVPDTMATRPRLAWLRERGMGASILVAALAAAFGVILVEVTAYIGAVLQADPFIGDSETLTIVVIILSVLLTGVAMYVAAVVTANTFSTIIAGRTRRIALMRLIGASARSQRAEVTGQGLVVGAIGAIAGLAVGLAASALGMLIGDRLIANAPDGAILAQPAIAVPAIGVALTTWLAAHIGSRRVLAVTPLQALGGSVERTHEQVSGRRGTHVAAWVLIVAGAALLAAGVAVGLVTPLGVVVAFFGGVLSFTGIVTGSALFMPPVLRLVGRMLGRGATARLAAENALRHPERSSRMAIGVVMGVALVTMFAVALESSKALMMRQTDDVPADFFAPMDAFADIMMVLVAVSAVIAAVGLVNLLTIGVVQRRRELGLLRAIGLTGSQVRRMVLLEAVHITVAATVTGLVLGIAYGWIAAQSLLGAVPVLPDFQPAGFVYPAVPWGPVAVIVAATALLTVIAAVTPTRLATRVAPVEALAAD
ncbi:FtsX-like permease family protein [Microbacterium sp. ARD32]|uniref:ABC transporter permease n=1 Tax=Microbacterium sp. ARD32 TaxID=2962577 RepID=UPI002880D25A|nr:FtsX-like permease family protein [Microbacterium sp. ARD32]MDT0156300.1 FtsX-like permease family protein [Microbacterium sp. ARD32]